MAFHDRFQVPSRWLAMWIAQTLVVVTLGLLLRWEPIDDAYISFRYASNWADGAGLVFNPGERVEGYTNFLWTAMLAGTALAGLDLPSASIVMGCILSMIAVALATWLAARVSEERGWSTSVPVMTAWMLTLFPGWSYWAFGGMEVMLLTCLVLGFLLAGCRRDCTTVPLFAAGALGVAMTMTRWETVLLWPIPILAIALDTSVPTRSRWLRVSALSALLVVGFGTYFVARFAYYGDLMPNTYYAKAGASFWARISIGVQYTGELGVSWLLPITGLAWLWGVRGRWSAAATATLVIYGGYVTWTGGDAFPWLRFFVPVFPICALLGAAIVEKIARLRRPATMPRARLAGATLLVGIFGTTALALDHDAAQDHLRWLNGWKTVADWMRSSVPADFQVVAAPIGIIGFYGERHVIDFLGLTDREIAHEGSTDRTEPPGHQRHHIESVLSRHAEIILGNGAVFTTSPSEPEAVRASVRKPMIQMLSMNAFRDAYRFAVAQVGESFIPVWIRRDIPPALLSIQQAP